MMPVTNAISSRDFPASSPDDISTTTNWPRSFLGGLLRVSQLRFLRALILPILTVALWQGIVLARWVNPVFLPAPSEVVKSWWTWAFGKQTGFTWTSGTFFHFSYLSIRRVLVGYAIGGAVGVFLGIAIGWYRVVSDVFDSFVQLLRPIPITGWLPFATLIFGIHESAAVFLIAFGCFFPVVVNTTTGARQTPRLLVRAALMLGTKRHKLLFRVVMPGALPSIVAGLRLGLGVAWVLVVVAEMLAVKGGLGFALWSAFTFIRMDLIIAALITLGAFGWITDRVIVILSRRLLRWQHGLLEEA